MIRLLFSVFFLITVFIACNEVAESTSFKHPDEIHNPNGDSELALVMRELHFEANKVRESLVNNEEADLTVLKELSARVSVAEPTDSAVVDESFLSFSEMMNDRVAELEAGHENVLEFNAIVNTCVSCHKTTCPGPIKKIQKLKIKGEA